MPAQSPPPLPGAPVRLLAADGVRLAAWHVPPPRGDDAGLGVLVVHGFTGSMAREPVQQVARILSEYAGVLLLDQRGHGGSQGLSTLGDREVLDVDAGLEVLRRLGYGTVAAVGWSMGASGVLRHAGLIGGDIDGHPVVAAPDLVVTVSGTSRWGVRDTTAMRRVTWLVTSRLGRRVSRFMGARIEPGGWRRPQEQWPMSPLQAAGRLSVPLLVVHGDRDHYFTLEHPRALYDAARGAPGAGAQLWELPGFGHAEAAAAEDPAMLHRLGAHLLEAARAGKAVLVTGDRA